MRPGSRKLRILGVLVVLMMAVGTLAYGQGAAVAGSLFGMVADASGAILPGVDVTLKNNSTGAVSHAVTDATGKFEVPSLEPGSYTATISLSGFKTVQLPDVVVAIGAPTSVKTITLEIGQLEETVVVTGATRLVQAETAAVSSTLTTAQISRVPLATRNTLDFVAALPGVNTSRYVRYSTVMGLQWNAINITLDGMNVQDNFNKSTEGLFALIHPRMDAIAEVSVSTASAGADSTGQGAVQVRLATRSGTNQFQGSAYGYYRRTRWNTNYWFNERDKLPRDEINLDVQGFRLGGPVKRDTLFFFFNYEQFDVPGATQAFSRTVLTDNAAAGIFNYKVAAGGIGEVNLWGLAAQYNQLATYDPVIRQMLAGVQATLGQGTLLSTGSPHTQTFKYSSPSLEQVRRFPTLRMDYNVTPRHRVGVSSYYQQFEAFPIVGAEARYPGFPGASGQASNRWSAMGNWRWVVSSNLVSEVRGGSTASRGPLVGWKLTRDQ